MKFNMNMNMKINMKNINMQFIINILIIVIIFAIILFAIKYVNKRNETFITNGQLSDMNYINSYFYPLDIKEGFIENGLMPDMDYLNSNFYPLDISEGFSGDPNDVPPPTFLDESDKFFNNYYSDTVKITNDNKDQINTAMKENTCSKEFLKDSFCQYNINEQKCECKFQKDDVKKSMFANPGCCDTLCSQYTREQCLQDSVDSQIDYYCPIAGKCQKGYGTIKSNHISANNCGTDILNNQIVLPFPTVEECNAQIDPCDKYNDPNTSHIDNKNNCLRDNQCGYCTNEYGKGKCINGTAEGPLDLQKYFYCVPTNRNNVFSYDYGNHASYILQSNITFDKKNGLPNDFLFS